MSCVFYYWRIVGADINATYNYPNSLHHLNAAGLLFGGNA